MTKSAGRKKERRGCSVGRATEVCMRMRLQEPLSPTALLTSILAQISRDLMPETCRKQNGPEAPACVHGADLLETPSTCTTWFITSLTTTIAASTFNSLTTKMNQNKTTSEHAACYFGKINFSIIDNFYACIDSLTDNSYLVWPFINFQNCALTYKITAVDRSYSYRGTLWQNSKTFLVPCYLWW